MPALSLRPILADRGLTSVRALVQQNGVSDPSVSHQAQIAAIRTHYDRVGAHRSGLGFPLGTTSFSGGFGEQRFAGGHIKFQGLTPNGFQDTAIRIRYVGFHCIAESDSDGLSPTDEPYFIVGVAATNGSNTRRFGPYENVESGSDRFDATLLADPVPPTSLILTPPIVIGVVAFEHDHGTPEEAEEKVREIIKEIENKFDQAVASFSGGATAGSHVLPEWARDILIGWVPEAIAAVFGLGDDTIGSTPSVMFDFNPGVGKWTTPARIGMHGQNPYNTVVPVDGGGEGKYELRFQVEVLDVNITVQPVG
jgi:hypothetical protein